MSDHLAWAKDPLLARLPQLQSNLDVRIIYGGDSWITPKLTEADAADYIKKIKMCPIFEKKGWPVNIIK